MELLIICLIPYSNNMPSGVYSRDNWTCQTCGTRGGRFNLVVHHIKSFSNVMSDNNIKTTDEAKECSELWDLSNGVTLCNKCHELTDNYGSKSIKL